ncbi:MAG: LemA family protein, partial [Candidatus Acidiferrales bacterium]
DGYVKPVVADADALQTRGGYVCLRGLGCAGETLGRVSAYVYAGGTMIGWIVLAVVVIAVIVVIGMYNGLVRLKVQCDNAWSDIDVQLKRRYDLIPNLVETVKGYAAHEKTTLEGVVQARNAAMSAQGPAAKAGAENMLTGALRQLFALSEAYPQLRAVESFTQLQNTLNQLEDSIQNARRYYNAVVRDFNTKIAVFPSNVIANMFNFKTREFFEVAAPAERETPKVSFQAGAPQ